MEHFPTLMNFAASDSMKNVAWHNFWVIPRRKNSDIEKAIKSSRPLRFLHSMTFGFISPSISFTQLALNGKNLFVLDDGHGLEHQSIYESKIDCFSLVFALRLYQIRALVKSASRADSYSFHSIRRRLKHKFSVIII